MHVTEAVLAPLRERYGEPRPLRWEGEVSDEEFTLADYSPQRRHDVTVLHYDHDFDLIADVTGQRVEWIVPRGRAS